MSTLQLDRSDEGVDELVGQWADGKTYQVRLTIRQVSSSPKMNNFEVVEVADEGDGYVYDEPAKKATKPEVEVKY